MTLFQASHRVVLVALCAVLWGCSQEQSSPSTSEQGPSSTPTDTSAGSPAQGAETAPVFTPVPGVTFNVIPDSVAACGGKAKPIKALVKWDTTQAGVKFVDILVGKDHAKQTVFARGKATGEKATGEWITPGTVVSLVDSSSQKQIGEVRVSQSECTTP